jgi:hypothetical protein
MNLRLSTTDLPIPLRASVPFTVSVRLACPLVQQLLLMRAAEVLDETFLVGLPRLRDKVAWGNVNGSDDRFDIRDRGRPDVASLVELGPDEVGEGGVGVDGNGKIRRDIRRRDFGYVGVEAAAETRDKVRVYGNESCF